MPKQSKSAATSAPTTTEPAAVAGAPRRRTRSGPSHSGHNRVDLRGQVTGEPRLRTFESGSALFTFSLRVPGRAGRFTSVPVCVWDADVVGADVVEGDVVRVRGSLVRRFWADPAGGRRSVVEVVADDVAPTGRPKSS